MTLTDNTYTVGDAKVTRVTETLLTGLTPSFLYPDWNASVLDEQPGLRSTLNETGDSVVLSVHTWVVEVGGQTILIDTGIGNDKDRPFSRLFHRLQTPFLQRLQMIGIPPEKVDHVLLTHLHADHVGWNTVRDDGRWIPTFPNAKYVFAQAELDFFATPESENRRRVFEDSVAPVIEAKQAITINPHGERYLDAFYFHPTPGHSAGHMSISLTSRGKEALFTGDIMHSPLQVYRPEWNSVFCGNHELARQSRQWALEYVSERKAISFTAHFPNTSAGFISRKGNGFEWKFI